jgi:hypothetical protein
MPVEVYVMHRSVSALLILLVGAQGAFGQNDSGYAAYIYRGSIFQVQPGEKGGSYEIAGKELKSGRALDLSKTGVDRGLEATEVSAWSVKRGHVWFTASPLGFSWMSKDVSMDHRSIVVAPIDPASPGAKAFAVELRPLHKALLAHLATELNNRPIFYSFIPRDDFTVDLYMVTLTPVLQKNAQRPQEGKAFMSCFRLLPWKSVGAFNMIEGAKWEPVFEVSCPFSEPFNSCFRNGQVYHVTASGKVFRHSMAESEKSNTMEVPTLFAQAFVGPVQTYLVYEAETETAFQIGWDRNKGTVLRRNIGELEPSASSIGVQGEPRSLFDLMERAMLKQEK